MPASKQVGKQAGKYKWAGKQAGKYKWAGKQVGEQASKQEAGEKASKASEQLSRQGSSQAQKHLEGIQSEPCPGGACYFYYYNYYGETHLIIDGNFVWMAICHEVEIMDGTGFV